MAAAYREAAYITRTIRIYFVLPNWSPALLIVSLISQVTSMCPMRESGPCVNESAGVRQRVVPVICIMARMISNCTFCDSKVLLALQSIIEFSISIPHCPRAEVGFVGLTT